MEALINRQYSDESLNNFVKFQHLSGGIKALEQSSLRIQFEEFSKGKNRSFNVLDLGCGYGRYTEMWREFTEGEIIGIDISQNIISEAIMRENKYKNNINYLLGNAFEIEKVVGNKTFDAISAIWVLNYATSKEKLGQFFKQLRKHLKEGGIFLACVLYDWTPFKAKEAISLPLGFNMIPTNKNYERSSFIDGEQILFQIFEPCNPENLLFETLEYYYSNSTFCELINDAELKPELIPLSYSKEIDSILEEYNISIILKASL